MKKTRTLLAVVAASAGLVALAGPAQAANPPGDPITPFTLPADTPDTDGYCLFPVLFEGFDNTKVRKTTGPNGETISKATGSLTVTVTNTVTGKKLTFNASGPGTTTTFTDGSFTLDLTGQNLAITTVANSFPGVPPLNYSSGHLQVSVAASGLTTSYKLNGTATNVCAALT
jgi:hypothetical protein